MTHTLLNNIETDDTDQQLMASITSIIQQNLPLKICHYEADYLMTFLIIQGYKPGTSSLTTPDSLPLAYKLTNKLIDKIYASHILIDNEQLTETNLIQTILNIHVQFTTFYIEPTTFISLEQIDFFKETYPFFDKIVISFIEYLQTLHKLELNKNNIVNLYFSYMFALINEIPAEMLRNKVHICVDFSQGELYTNYIIKTLNAFNNAHIIIERIPSEQTDIYLSDFHNISVSQIQIIWRNPPTPSDWTLLGDTIILCKK